MEKENTGNWEWRMLPGSIVLLGVAFYIGQELRGDGFSVFEALGALLAMYFFGGIVNWARYDLLPSLRDGRRWDGLDYLGEVVTAFGFLLLWPLAVRWLKPPDEESE